MKIALIGLPHPENTIIVPPLPMGYVAALLEQQRHIVRIYDMALRGNVSLDNALIPLRAFRPHLAVVASDDPAAMTTTRQVLGKSGMRLLGLHTGLRELTAEQTIVQAVGSEHELLRIEDEQNVIFRALLALEDDLDTLPFPARHLLPLEQYPLFTPVGERQTTVLIGRTTATGTVSFRTPALIIAELRSVAREHGIRHFLFSGPSLTHDLAWLHDLLYHLGTSNLGISWEGSMRYEQMTPELVQLCHRSGAEIMSLAFNAMEVLGSKSNRMALSAVVKQAHDLGITVRGNIRIEPPYDLIPAVVDMSATFGLDDARFSIQRPAQPTEQASSDPPALANMVEMAHLRYQSSRGRQFFLDRFGPHLGAMLWYVRHTGLLGREWQRDS